jgi:hypothetical protein
MVGPFVLLDLTGQAGSDRCGEFERENLGKIGSPGKSNINVRFIGGNI